MARKLTANTRSQSSFVRSCTSALLHDGRIVDQYVGPLRPSAHRAGRPVIGDVGRKSMNIRAEGTERFESCRVGVDTDHCGPEFGKKGRCGEPDAGRGAGYYGNFPLELHRVRPLSR